MNTSVDKRIKQLDVLIEMTRLINSTLNTREICTKATSAARELLHTQAGSLLLLDRKNGELFFEVALGEKGDAVRQVRLPPGEGIAGWVVKNDKPIIVHNVKTDPRFFKGVDDSSGFNTTDLICVPVKSQKGLLGALQAVNSLEKPFEDEDMIILHALADQVAIALENAALHQQAITDGMTGLYHHQYLETRLAEELDRAKRYKHALTLLMIDIDFFKTVNDRYGHVAGDKMLQRFAKLIKQNIRLSDVAARYGGEEFAIILPYSSFEDGMLVGERLRIATEALEVDDIRITISIGLAFCAMDCKNISPRRLTELADQALYSAKQNGRNRTEGILVD